MHMATREEFRVIEVRTGQVGEQHTECDGEQQQRLEFVMDSEIEQEEGYADHDDVGPSHRSEESDDTRGFDKFLDALSYEIGGGH